MSVGCAYSKHFARSPSKDLHPRSSQKRAALVMARLSETEVVKSEETHFSQIVTDASRFTLRPDAIVA